MKYRARILILFGGFFLSFAGILAFLTGLYTGVGQDLKDVASTKYTSEVLIRDSDKIAASLHGDILNALILSPENRQPVRDKLDRDTLKFQNNMNKLLVALPGSVKDLSEALEVFKTYYAYASSLLDVRTLESLGSDRDAVAKIRENKAILSVIFNRTSDDSRRNFEQALRDLQDSMTKVQNLSVLISLGFVLTGLLLVFLFTSRLAKPLEIITSAAENLTKGRLEVRVSGKFGGEVGTLAKAFNLMAGTLEEDFGRLNHEIEERKALEIRERRLQARLAGILEAQPAGLAALEDHGVVTLWTRVAQEITGVSRSEVEGQVLWDVIPELSQFEGAYWEAKKTLKPSGTITMTYPGEVKKLIEVILFPVPSDQEPGVVLRMIDITEEERKEAQLRQLQKMDTVGTLAGGLAHDFNNVLGAVVGSVSVMDYNLKNGQNTADDMIPLVETIQYAANRASGIIRQLLTLARTDDRPQDVPVNLKTVLDQTLDMARSAFDKTVEIRFFDCPEKALTLGDPSQLEQAFLNILINANHAMTIMRPKDSPYGGLLTLGVTEIQADEHFCQIHPGAQPAAYWQVSVSDTGVGMDGPTLKRIFDPFFTTKTAGQGTGLGLSMVFNMIKQHHGFIEVYSEPGAGATFRIYLPKILVNWESQSAEVTVVRGRGTILVVDDEGPVRDLAKKMLSIAGYQVLGAKDGLEALEVYRERHREIDLVLLDLSMPRRSGRETFLDLKSEFPRIKVLMTSGFGGDERFKDLLDQGILGIIEKPFNLGTLSAAVARGLKSET